MFQLLDNVIKTLLGIYMIYNVFHQTQTCISKKIKKLFPITKTPKYKPFVIIYSSVIIIARFTIILL